MFPGERDCQMIFFLTSALNVGKNLKRLIKSQLTNHLWVSRVLIFINIFDFYVFAETEIEEWEDLPSSCR